MANRPKSSAGPALRMLMVLLLIGVAWRVFSLGMADAKSRSAPEQALQWRPQHSSALFFLAEQQVKNPASFEAAKKNAIAALHAYPFEARAYRVLAQAADAEKKPELAFILYQKAVRYAPRDLESHLWLLNYSLRTEDADAAVDHLDKLLRMQIDLLKPLVPTIGGLAVRPSSQTALISSLIKNPNWRTPAMRALLSQQTAASEYALFFNRLSKAGAGLSELEQQAWLIALSHNQDWGLAYLSWANQLPSERQLQLSNVFNGGFEYEPLEAEFDWQFDYVPGASIERAFREGVQGESALRVRFDDQRVSFNSVRQTLVLPAGKYRLSGLGFAEDLRTEIGLVWSVQCMVSGIALANSEPWKGRSRDWEEFSMDFEVPASRCPAQWLLLKLPARFPSEQAIGGAVWFDSLRVQKIQGLTELKPKL
jgi:tetratricopeptide (TPR) repeat protein